MEDTVFNELLSTLKSIAQSSAVIANALAGGRSVRVGKSAEEKAKEKAPERAGLLGVDYATDHLAGVYREMADRLVVGLVGVDEISSRDVFGMATGRPESEWVHGDKVNAGRLLRRMGFTAWRTNKADEFGKRPEYWRRMSSIRGATGR